MATLPPRAPTSPFVIKATSSSAFYENSVHECEVLHTYMMPQTKMFKQYMCEKLSMYKQQLFRGIHHCLSLKGLHTSAVARAA